MTLFRPSRRPWGGLAVAVLAFWAATASAQTSFETASPAPSAPISETAPTDAPAEGVPAEATPEGLAGDLTDGDPAGEQILPHNLSPWGMFLSADWVVKTVMIGLALASIATWTVWVAKTLELRGHRRRLRDALGTLESARTLDDAAPRFTGTGTVAAIVRAAGEEAAACPEAPPAGVKERVASRLTRIEAGFARRLSRGTGILATIGSTAPFVGLFGTVWGIMNSFIGISKAQTTNLAVVAPGIAEALLATALGLVAAIPAVIIYNAFARATAGVRAQVTDVSATVERLVGRDLDRLDAGAGRARAAE